MRKKKLIISCLIVAFICLIISILPVVFNLLDEDDSNFSYNNMNVTATINTDGSLSMHEEFTLETNSAHTYIREIIYSKDNKSNYSSDNQPSFDDESFKVTVINGDKTISRNYLQGERIIGNDIIAFDGEKDELGDYIQGSVELSRNFIVYLSNGINKNTKYVIDYKINKAVNIFNDVCELNWKLIPSLDAKKKNVNLTLNLPDNNYTLGTSQDEGDIHYYGYGGINSKFTDCTNKQIKAFAKKLNSNEEMEVLCYFPSNMIPVKEGTNYFDQNGEDLILDRVNVNLAEENAYAKRYNTYKYSALVISIIFIGLIGFTYFNIYRKYDKELKASFDGEYYRELPASYPPAEMGYLYNEEIVSSNDLSATLMDLIRRKYISIDQNGCSLTEKTPNYKLIFDRNKDLSELTEYEGYLLYWYFDVMAKGGNEITLNEIDKFVSTESDAKKYSECNKIWGDKVLSVGKKDNFFDDEARKNAQKFNFMAPLGIILAMYVLFIVFSFGINFLAIFGFIIATASVCLVIYTRQIRRRSQKGNEDFVKWKAFKKFLEEFSHFEDYPMPSIIVWEHYLVYATSFGIADVVEKQLRTKFKEMENVDVSDTLLYYPSFNNYISYRVGRASALGKQTIVTAQAQRMAKSGSSGGHGGFGGGSSFGGGGGHSSVR
ncbi:membrane protein-like protein [Firmicutes bacterium CAG:449]|nr:membrane protein-like protein [Firmicutes bacterium CAG:449]